MTSTTPRERDLAVDRLLDPGMPIQVLLIEDATLRRDAQARASRTVTIHPSCSGTAAARAST